MMSDGSKYYFCSPIRITRTRDQETRGSCWGRNETCGIAEELEWGHCEPGHRPGPGLDLAWTVVGQIVKIANKLVGMWCRADSSSSSSGQGWPLQLVKLYHFIFYSSVWEGFVMKTREARLSVAEVVPGTISTISPATKHQPRGGR